MVTALGLRHVILVAALATAGVLALASSTAARIACPAGIAAPDSGRLTAEDERLIARNPALRDVWCRAPAQWPGIRDAVRDAQTDPDPAIERRMLTPDDREEIRENPALEEIYRVAPHAANDLLWRIKHATGRPKS